MLLKDKIACVTGAAALKSIGFATAQRFVEEGAKVILADLDASSLDAACERLGGAAFPLQVDVASPDAVARAGATIGATFGRLDILVNNAGIARPRPTVGISISEWTEMLDINLRGSFLMIQQALPLMRAGSSIICIASIAAQRGGGLMGGPHYAASKGGILGLVRAVAREQGNQGIRVNAINPGVIMTALTEGFYDEELTAKVMPQIPLNRFGVAEDVANTCVFLASDLSAYITGSSIDVNGGMHMS
ncbi:SDR family NAD(P)-dependent oxidoreductase [Microvirga terricola]|uniref:SDR family oxidoreductase n=1 Tax=Microvirga terricola TaxID=2719797 RepID=A0ABX0V9Q4_9HYPH|nr:SDR family oxidoreductase [Microvirga terricola]NIX75934.1 SDR family oxidoreductase [Microvirga terricola]